MTRIGSITGKEQRPGAHQSREMISFFPVWCSFCLLPLFSFCSSCTCSCTLFLHLFFLFFLFRCFFFFSSSSFFFLLLLCFSLLSSSRPPHPGVPLLVVCAGAEPSPVQPFATSPWRSFVKQCVIPLLARRMRSTIVCTACCK